MFFCNADVMVESKVLAHVFYAAFDFFRDIKKLRSCEHLHVGCKMHNKDCHLSFFF